MVGNDDYRGHIQLLRWGSAVSGRHAPLVTILGAP